MENLHIGSIINEPQQRDAVHMAIVPVTAMERLYPGTHVGIVQTGEVPKDSDGIVADALDHGLKGIGIVDPFLRNPVQKGERFWLFLYPGSITSLRHDWRHPSFMERSGGLEFSERTATSKKWLSDWARNNLGIDYEYLLEQIKESKGGSIYSTTGDSGDIPGEFWIHYEIATGEKIDPNVRTDYFSCSC